jgi:hypothetical protein
VWREGNCFVVVVVASVMLDDRVKGFLGKLRQTIFSLVLSVFCGHSYLIRE